MVQKKEEKTIRLKRLEQKLLLILKSKDYVENELKKIRQKEMDVRGKIRKEKKAISFVNRAKKLR